MSERSPTELILAHQERLDQVNSEQDRLDITAHEYLKSLYQDPNQPPSLRLRAAVKAIEVETPRAPQRMLLFDGATFAEALEKCIERSKSPLQLNGPVEPLPPEEAKRPMARYRRF